MAYPIMDNPLLTGKDAETFLEKQQKNNTKKLSMKDHERMQKNYDELKLAFVKAGLF